MLILSLKLGTGTLLRDRGGSKPQKRNDVGAVLLTGMMMTHPQEPLHITISNFC